MAALRRRSRLQVEEPPAGAPLWAMTFGNLALVLLAFFVLLYATGYGAGAEPPPAAAQGGGEAPGGAKQLPQASLSSVKRRITARLEEQKATALVRFEDGPGALIIHLDASALYDSGRAEIKAQAIPALDAVGGVLSTVGNLVKVEGHSDSDPMIPSQQFPDNWALSSARAAGVLRYLREYHQIASDRLSVAGYADTRPVASNATPEGKAKNRRVDIVVYGR